MRMIIMLNEKEKRMKTLMTLIAAAELLLEEREVEVESIQNRIDNMDDELMRLKEMI